jgi:two-component system response regulator VicR
VSGADPNAQSSNQGERTDTHAAPEQSQAGVREPFLVLIAEDEEPIAEAIAMLVEDCGYTPLIANNGRQALELARARRPALIITDLMMPYLDGDELITALRSDAARDAHQPAPTILLSAAGLRRMQVAHADVLLPKPFDLDDLERLLLRFLGPPPAGPRP